MKKIASFLALVIVFCSLVGCSNSDSQNKKAEAGIWNVQKTTDEFGDVTADSQDVISASVQGTYENETTTESKLGVSVNLRKRVDVNHYVIEFQLTENGTSKIQYEEDSDKIFKTKVDEEIQDYYLTLEESSGKLSVGNEDFVKIEYGGDYIFSNLYNGKDVKCVIEIEDSASYSFELKSDNFKSLCEANSLTKGAGDITVKESVNFLLHDKGIMIDESCKCLKDNYETFKIVKTDELKEILNGEFLEISLEYDGNNSESFRRWDMMKYSAEENIREEIGKYVYSERTYRREFTTVIGKTDIEIKDDVVKYYKLEFETRKISENIFILRTKVDYGEGIYPEFNYSILIKCEDFASYTLKQGIQYAQDNYIQQIPY